MTISKPARLGSIAATRMPPLRVWFKYWYRRARQSKILTRPNVQLTYVQLCARAAARGYFASNLAYRAAWTHADSRHVLHRLIKSHTDAAPKLDPRRLP